MHGRGTTFCVFDRPISIRLSANDIDFLKIPLYRTIYIAQIERENEVLRANIRLGNAEPCRCEYCNPDTSGDY